jgi:hypothetical protein
MQEFDFEFKYVQGKANGAADALSRKETKQIQPTWESLRMDKWKGNLPLYVNRFLPIRVGNVGSSLQLQKKQCKIVPIWVRKVGKIPFLPNFKMGSYP